MSGDKKKKNTGKRCTGQMSEKQKQESSRIHRLESPQYFPLSLHISRETVDNDQTLGLVEL